MNKTNNATATITVHDATPSAHYPADEQARNGAMDYSVTIEIASSAEESWWAWHDADQSRWEPVMADAEARCVAWIAGESDDGPARARTIEGSITLYRDDANGGMSPCGTPIEGWCSGEIVTWLRTLDERAYSVAVSSLAGGVGTEDVTISS